MLLEQKQDYYYKKLNAKANMSKKRDRHEMSGGDPKDYTNNAESNHITEDLLIECEENDYKP